MKYGNATLGQVEAVWNKLGGEEGVNRLLRGELVVSEPVRNWQERDGVIYFSLTSNGMTGEEWIKHLEKKGHKIGDYAKSVLRSKDFKPTKGKVYKIAVLKGELFSDENRITSNIRREADKRKLTKPNAEIACLIRDMFSDKEIEAMGLYWIAVMHEPIKANGSLVLLGAGRDGDGSWFNASYDDPDRRRPRGRGFAFVASQD